MQEINSLTLSALIRAGSLSVLTLAVALPIRDVLLSTSSRTLRMAAWAFTLAPWLSPSLLLGYAYMPLALALVRHAGWKEIMYDVTLWVRLTPVAVCVLCFAPPSLSAQALCCYRLLPMRPSPWSRINFRIRGAGRGPWAALALVFLLAFGEFELASLWTVKTWSVALFDAQAGGLALNESLFLARWPLGCAAVGIMVGVAALHGRWRRSAADGRAIGVEPMKRWLVLSYLTIMALLALIGPLAQLLPDAWLGLGALAGNAGLAHDISFSLLLAVSAATAAWLMTCEMNRRGAVSGALAAPGLFGALLLSLLILALFQFPIMRAAYGTPVPLLMALTLLLLPFALLLHALLHRQRRGPALHLAKQTGHARLCWELETHKTFWAGFLIFCWAYFDLTAASLLAPPGMTTVSVRLYNLIHYGRSPALAAMLCAAIATPAVTAGLTASAARTLGWPLPRLRLFLGLTRC